MAYQHILKFVMNVIWSIIGSVVFMWLLINYGGKGAFVYFGILLVCIIAAVVYEYSKKHSPANPDHLESLDDDCL
jgi:hypothetical protein